MNTLRNALRNEPRLNASPPGNERPAQGERMTCRQPFFANHQFSAGGLQFKKIFFRNNAGISKKTKHFTFWNCQEAGMLMIIKDILARSWNVVENKALI